jgi:hypothetical protein
MTFRHLRNARGFFSDYYLGSVFGRTSGRGRRRGLSDRETDLACGRFRRIRERAEGRAADPAECRERFARPLLRDLLGFHLGAGDDRVHGLFASADAEAAGDRPLLVCYCGGFDADLDAGRGTANPVRRVETALARLRLRHGLLLTGERLRLVRAAGDGPRGAYLEVDLEGLAEEDDPGSFAALLRLFSAAAFRPDAEGRVPIEEVERESRAHAEKVSDDLKQAVFASAESLVAGLVADAVARGRIASPLALSEAGIRTYRDAALLGLYRILFILYAEARDARLDEHRLYRESYSAEGLVDEVRRDPIRDWPENRATLWERLRALFHIYDKGLPPITPWENIPPRGGDFFSAETPEGRLLDQARLPDRAVVRIVRDLATTAPRRGVGRERVSFRELDIENLGAVYEGLLEYEPRIARETMLEVRVQGRAYALAPDEVVRLCRQKDLVLKGEFAAVAGTSAASLHPDAAEEEDDAEADMEEDPVEAPDDAAGESAAGGEETGEEPESEDKGVERGATARVLRRVEPGGFHFVPGPGRKGSGSFYTVRPLVQDLVRHALGPLIEGGTAADIERLRVLDPACGSAHFLVEAMRFLGQALHRAYSEEHGGKAPPGFESKAGRGWDADWPAPDEEARAANSEARAWCKRRIAERCLFGVDLNPTAVTLARVALWIESVAGDRPLTYFEHHVRCGNSLLGSWMARLEAPPIPALGRGPRAPGERDPHPGLFQREVRKAIEAAARARRTISAARPEDLRREGVDPETVAEQEFKEHLRRQAEETLAAARLLFDLRSAAPFVPGIWAEWTTLCSLVGDPERLRAHAGERPWWDTFRAVRDRERFFHWEIEFPEVFLDPARPGFDAVLGNPPWDKVKPDKKEFYGRHDILIRAFVGGDLDRRIAELHAAHPGLAEEFRAYTGRIKTLAACLKKGGDYRFQDWEIDGRSTGGDPDVFKFFVERAWRVAAVGGRVGFVVPSAIYNNEGCTGLRHLLLHEAAVERFYAFENRKKIFPIHSSYKFVSLVFRKERPERDGFEAAFMRHDLGELSATARHREPGRDKVVAGPAPWVVTVRRSELERLSPGTLAFLEYRSPRDREILLKMYGYDARGNPVNPRPLLGDQGPGTWNARFYREFDMTNDRDLWTDPKTGRLWNPRQILGPVPGTTDRPPFYDPAAWPAIRAAMAEKGFWPLYEGKKIHQFFLDVEAVERWVSLAAVEHKYEQMPAPKQRLALRNVSNVGNERTMIAAAIPPRAFCGHKLTLIETAVVPVDTACALLNTLSADYAIRLRGGGGGGANLDHHVVARLAVLDNSNATLVPSVVTASVAGTGVKTPADTPDLWGPIWLTNRAVAEAYGLGPEDFEHILSTFPVFARKRPGFHAYLLERLAEWREEAGTADRRAFPAREAPPLPRVAEALPTYGGERESET